MDHTNSEEGDIYAEWPFIWSPEGRLYVRWSFLAHELQRTQEGRSSKNSVKTKFREYPFHALR